MLNKKLAIKIAMILLIDLILQSLLFTGTFIIQSNKNINLPIYKSVKHSKRPINLLTSENAIYLQIASEENNYQVNLIKYDPNLNQIWKQSYNYSKYLEGIIAVNDENALLHIFNASNYYSDTHYSILNENGYQLNFTQEQHPEINWYQSLIIGYGSGYLFIFKKLVGATIQIVGILLAPNNTTSILFEQDLHHVNFNFDELFIQNPYYLNSQTLEIPFYIRKFNETGLNYFISASYFLEYKINKKSIEQKISNYFSIENRIANQQTTKKGIDAEIVSPFHYNLNFLGLDAFVTKERTQFNIFTENGNVSSYITHDFFSRPFNSYTYMGIVPGFQIKDKYYFNIYFNENYQAISYSSHIYMPVLLIYSQYSFHSNLDYYNYSNFVSKGEQINFIVTNHIGNNLIYYGQISQETGETYYFIRISKIQTSILDFTYQLPLILKLLIGSLLIFPIFSYFYKKSKKATPSSETYPLN